MVLENAPVTGLLLGISVLSLSFTPRQYITLQHPYVASGWKTTIRRLPLETLPFGLIGVSLIDVTCTLLILFQMRILERRWGSSLFLAFVMTSAMTGSVLLNMFITESTPPLNLDQLRILSSGGSIVPLVALVTRYVLEVRSLCRWRVPLLPIVITEWSLVFAPLIRLVMFPATEIRPRTHKQRAIHVDIGSWTRLMLTLLGIVWGIASKETRLLKWWLSFSSRYICRPFINFIRPVLSCMAGSTSVVELGIPQQNSGEQTVTSGRYTVDNLAGLQVEGHVRVHRARPPANALFGEQMRRRNERNSGSHGGSTVMTDAVTEERIAQIMELGLGFDAETIRLALIDANGYVDMAVEKLVSRL
ncbi:hypothetical protein C3747_42g53 [Trypanosoma cruzi]|uniref:UBA domain-containing protein n=2 Tax=Trypanosoma cruzi TaxID=5693 RepID=Q4D4W8_TRYCC|nr:hypothetical protein, conserved [Trypanosoma cruzi]EAN87576.1 hypothetical protein, conserved [Trypanosoma cruzi]PWV13574.1 hypothetical protein C3747_42g53 [Trypanosoma cruzi]RNC47424.1 hypothetical protein TcCL_NonESM02759 [Trypanosoma cruzi]|eukprot:XP_809427.1 hypothetical protein [Trypanosoma cruzi strain CL Brener]